MKPFLPTLAAVLCAARRPLLAGLLLAGSGPLLAQSLNDIPMAVKNNVPPNFMFMIDSSGSMTNVVPASPYNASTDYSASGCTGGNVVGSSSEVWLRVNSGVPNIRISGTDYRHWSAVSTGSRRCFARDTVYFAKLVADNSGLPSSYLPAQYTGNYLNWYFGINGDATMYPQSGWSQRKRYVISGVSYQVQTRWDIAKASATDVINGLPVTSPPSVRVGLSAYSTTSGNGGRLVRGMGDLTATHRSNLTSSISSLTNSGNTPLAETLADIGRYMATGYTGNVSAGENVSNVSIDNFLRHNGRTACLGGATCTGNDAVPSSPSIGTTSRPIQYWCQRSYAFLMTDGRPQGDQELSNNTYLRDYDRDCVGGLGSNCVGGATGAVANWDRKTSRSYESNGSDYLDDVAKALFDVDLRPNLPSPDATARPKRNNLSTYVIGFADLQVQNDPLLISTAQQGGGLFLNAADGDALTPAFRRVVTDAFAKDASAAAVAVANAQITLNNVGYASSYRSGSWYGDLVAYSLDTSTGLQTGNDIWSLRSNLSAQSPSSRKIATFNGTAGVAFTSALTYAGMPSTLSSGVINYLRGDRTGEGSTYRQRQDVLGDIINAEPVVVTYSGNVPIIFQGANDGMLHVVDGRTSATATTRGQELWAYVPKLLHENLAELSDPAYSHRYYIDGTPAVAEVTGVGFSRLLVGGLGKGGRGYYALDISSYEAATEADVASKVKWEFSPTGMGYSYGTPLIVKVGSDWRVVVASGYDASVTGRVWVLNPADGSVVKTIDTGVGSSGLAHLGKLANVAADVDTSYVWGADNLGNVWRFDITGSGSASAVRIASLVDDGGSLAQPVTAAPEVSQVSGSTTRFLIQIGTGRYLADADVPGTGANTEATQRQSVYGLVDDVTLSSSAALISNLRGTNGSSCPTGGGNGSLVCQALSYNSGTGTYQATTHAVNLTTGRGWYLDLPTDSTPSSNNMINGRIVSKPAVTSAGTLALTVNIPTNVQCDPGGRSWFLALNSATGGAVLRNVGGNTYYDAGFFLGYALASRPVIVTTSAGKRALIRMSDKTVRAPEVPEPASTAAQWRRIYWRPVN
ncbi:hypothetical protein IP87_09810 [beta proteobacterium AAP121]|nr:hypothetical protein IP80_04800 [beta proteobacterium AAP65]KPF97767.1 hypothetical protein IP87_09810 [beta proteobacterium AAP121]